MPFFEVFPFDPLEMRRVFTSRGLAETDPTFSFMGAGVAGVVAVVAAATVAAVVEVATAGVVGIAVVDVVGTERKIGSGGGWQS